MAVWEIRLGEANLIAASWRQGQSTRSDRKGQEKAGAGDTHGIEVFYRFDNLAILIGNQ